MRLGLVSDVHANLAALEAALAALERAGVDRLVCAGDLVGYGPHPNACVARLAEGDVLAVAGNHDIVAVDGTGLDRCGPTARRTLEWTIDALEDDARAYLAALPAEREIEDVLVTHGALGDPWVYVDRDEDAAGQLAALAEHAPGARLLVLGHTHVPLLHSDREGTLLRGRGGRHALPADRRHLLNPGAVGQSRERRPVVRCAVVDLAARSVELLALRYDARGCRRDLERAGLPPRACHLWPTPRERAGRAARRVRSRVRGGAAR